MTNLLPRTSTYVVDLGRDLGRIHVSEEQLNWLFENRPDHGED